MKKTSNTGIVSLLLATGLLVHVSCTPGVDRTAEDLPTKIDVILDTDANNEVDDQHAIAYMLFNGNYFNVEGITVNSTSVPSGFDYEPHVDHHYEEAKRVMQLCGELYGIIPLKAGATDSFEEIRTSLDDPEYDGHEAVDFMIEQAMKERDDELVIIAIGKLTNVALAVKKEPRITSNIRVYWLGANYPEPGEHNLYWDIPSMNYLLDSDVPFEMVLVRYWEPSGTAAVIATQDEILHRMPGKGPQISEPVIGRHGGEFYNWGDYSANLFETYYMHFDPPGRSMFDMAAVAIVKNPEWAERSMIPAPIYDEENERWIDRDDNPREIAIWEWFDIYGIMNDFFQTMRDPVLAR